MWLAPTTEQELVLSIASRCHLSLPLAQTLVNRGFTDPSAVRAFLFGSESDIGDPTQLADAEKAVSRIMQAIEGREKILVFGDYDVDGITSSAMMMLCLPALGANINYFLPNRARDGYGLSTKVVNRAAANGYTLIITVDNGITAFDPVAKANEHGVDVIITDHHRPHGHMPDAYAIVNPNRSDCLYPHKNLAGVGVTFKLLSLLYQKKGVALPPKVYELLLLGTIADVVPLLGENRFWVRHGLALVNKTESFALKTLKKNSKVVKPALSATDIGFFLAPQINALGRLEDPREGVRFLIDADQEQVERVGTVLHELNQARKAVEQSILDEIEKKIASGAIDLDKENIILAAGDSWPTGVIGLVASRLVSKYGKPTLLFHLTKKGSAKGSCRSIPEFSIFDALATCETLIDQFGGHSQAAGLSLPQENLAKLKEQLEELVAQQLTPFDLQQKLALDAEANLSDLGTKFMQDLGALEPFGHQNACPVFFIKQVVMVQKPILMKEQHVKCHVFADGVIKPVLFFRRPELYEKFLQWGHEPFDIAVQVVENHWQGRVSIELIGLDVSQQAE